MTEVKYQKSFPWCVVTHRDNQKYLTEVFDRGGCAWRVMKPITAGLYGGAGPKEVLIGVDPPMCIRHGCKKEFEAFLGQVDQVADFFRKEDATTRQSRPPRPRPRRGPAPRFRLVKK